jgi:iron complex transport system permease protein
MNERMNSIRRTWESSLLLWLPILLSLLVLAVSISLSVGSAHISEKIVWKVLLDKFFFAHAGLPSVQSDPTSVIIWQIRLPRILLSALVGAALSAAGVAYQGVLRNPLADPFILGVSSGASLGAAMVMILGWQAALLGQWTLPLVAFLSGLLTLGAVYGLAQMKGRVQVESLILAGVVIQALISAVLSFLLTIAKEKLPAVLFWMMGSFSLADWSYIKILIPLSCTGIVIIWVFSGSLNVLSLGEETASYLGVPVTMVRIVLLVTASLLTGAAVSFSGVIGFVGLIIPHMVRLLFGSDHRVLLPLSVGGGALLLVIADTLARTLLDGIELPIGIFTALLGAPFFGYLLRKVKKRVFF